MISCPRSSASRSSVLNLHAPSTEGLPSTAALLLTDGDQRLALDPDHQRNRYGCRPTPDDNLVALGSATASNISTRAYDAAESLRQQCAKQLLRLAPAVVYDTAMQQIQRDLLQYCGGHPGDGTTAMLAASGTDIILLATLLSRPYLSISIAAAETGSGVPFALQGKHFCDTAEARAGTASHDWVGRSCHVPARHADGSLREASEMDVEYAALVDQAAAAGKRVLLVLTDLSKTGLIAPTIGTVLALCARWPRQLDVLVDACQFRLAPATIQGYLAQGWMVALTGSKFMSGPSFSGALLFPRTLAERFVVQPRFAKLVGAGVAGQWPGQCPPGPNAPSAPAPTVNFGLLLRWHAALAEMAHFAAIPEAARADGLASFAAAATIGLARHPALLALPVAAIDRRALGIRPGWDGHQTIFPFLLRAADGTLLNAEQSRSLYLQLQATNSVGRRFQLGQPVTWRLPGGATCGALRLCASARLIAEHYYETNSSMAEDVAAALATVAKLARAF